MKSLIKFKNLVYLFFITIGAMLLQGCAVYYPNNMASVPVSDIIQKSQDGVSSKDIIKELRKSHSVYFLKADQLAKLRNEGVQDSVINYMENTHINAIRRNQRMQDSYYMGPGMYGYGYYGFGWPYGGYWGWNMGPSIIIRGGRDYDGGHMRGNRGDKR